MSASHHQPAAALPQRASAAARGRARVAHSNGAPPPTDRRPTRSMSIVARRCDAPFSSPPFQSSRAGARPRSGSSRLGGEGKGLTTEIPSFSSFLWLPRLVFVDDRRRGLLRRSPPRWSPPHARARSRRRLGAIGACHHHPEPPRHRQRRLGEWREATEEKLVGTTMSTAVATRVGFFLSPVFMTYVVYWVHK